MARATPTAHEDGTAAIVPRGFRIADAARYMGVSPWYVEEKIRSKELPAHRFCRHYTIFKEDMDSFLDEQKRFALSLGRQRKVA
jgi:excisionase family DNA binding protein